MSGCGADTGGSSLQGVDLTHQAVIQGTVVRGTEALAGAYVRLLDRTGEFTAEVPTDEQGRFRFFAAAGEWRLRTLAPRSEPVDEPVTAALGEVAEVRVSV